MKRYLSRGYGRHPVCDDVPEDGNHRAQRHHSAPYEYPVPVSGRHYLVDDFGEYGGYEQLHYRGYEFYYKRYGYVAVIRTYVF